MSPDQYLAAATSNSVVLSSQEHRDVKSRIIDTEVTILAIHTELRRVADLKSQLVRKSTELRQLKVAIAPHKQLPDDVLQEIFSHFVQQGYILRIPRTSVIEGPWALRQVCSRWRKVALGCRFLWDTVYIDSRLPTWGNMSKFRTSDAQFLSSWLKRTNLACNILPSNGPINLSFRIYGKSGTVEKAMATDTHCNLISSNSSRIRSLYLDSSPLVMESFLSIQAPSKFPTLTSLSFVRTYCNRHEGYDGPHLLQFHDISLSSIIRGAPHLEKLSMDGHFGIFSNTAQPPILPRSQLTELTLDNTVSYLSGSTSVILPFLSQCVDLRYCKLRGIFVDTEEIHPPITLPHLRQLDLIGSPYHDFENDTDGYSIMRFFELPSLVTLSVREPCAGVCPLDQLIDLIQRSGCSRTLTSLHNFQSRLFDSDDAYEDGWDDEDLIMFGQFDYASVEELASLIPNVRDLVLALRLDMEHDLQPLANANLLPNLERLTFWTATSDLEVHGRDLKALLRRIKTSGKWRRLEEIQMFVTGDFDGLDEEITLNKNTNLPGDITVTVVPAFDECDIVTRNVKYIHSN